MFNIEDKDTIMDLINTRTSSEVVIPIYLKVGNDRFFLTEVEAIGDCSPSIFKVGFGSSDSVFIRNKFPKNRLIEFTNYQRFNHFDDDKQCATDYFVFESSGIEGNDSLTEEINKWYDLLLDYVMKHVEITKKELIRKTMEELS